MDFPNASAPQSVESGAQNNITSAPLAISTTEPDKVINIKTDSTLIGANVSDEELLKGLLTDQHCHVCEAVLLFEAQRLSHYEGKKHAQKLKLYLHNKRDELRHTESAGLLHRMPSDKDRFCELCNMVFTSPVVAKSHYEGKVHTKNLRKQSPQKAANNAVVSTLPRPVVDCATEDHVSESGDVTSNPNTASSDPNKYCVLCAASFNNPQMALQHYNGRKHQRKKARQEMLKELPDVQEENALTCAICNLQLNSVEMYQAHMQGNKHHARERKVFKLCKTRQKSYSTFADELAHYIQVQKARGLTPKIGSNLSKNEAQNEDDQSEEVADVQKGHMAQQNQTLANFSPTYDPHPRYRVPHFGVEGFQPPYVGPPWPSRGWDCDGPPSFQHLRPSLESAARPLKRRRKCSSSSSYSTSSSSSSSYSSSFSSGASDSDAGERRQRERRRNKRSRRERGRRSGAASSDKARRKQQKRTRDNYSEERRRNDVGESGDERRQKRKHPSKQRRQVRKRAAEEDQVKSSVVPTDTMETREETDANVVEQSDRPEDHAGVKCRKEKKKTKEIMDNRTEEEKLWDDSILGC
ncbi:zinc finger matrin-type protein 1 [Hippocampus zosterae]|uniref:zinc finger matrin-type protein 1 n=1 Tax=Hippocampus zosterae TaxID=109293 RepID=UPI00223C8CEE|nr:zinc finger matrin-type protein 1 [Hippocampus zosterae]